MKKLLFLLMALPLLAIGFTSCSDDDKDLPDVNIGFTYSGGTLVNNKMYVVKDSTFTVDSIYCEAAPGTKTAAITNVTYLFAGLPQYYTIVSPFTASFNTTGITPGTYPFNITMTVLQVDKSIARAAIGVPMVIVNDASEIPAAPDPSPDRTFHGSASPMK